MKLNKDTRSSSGGCAELNSAKKGDQRRAFGGAHALLIAVFAALLILPQAQAQPDPQTIPSDLWPVDPSFYSPTSTERVVEFDAVYRTQLTSLADVERLTQSQRDDLERYELMPTLKFLSGPLTQRVIAGPQRGTQLKIHWDRAQLAEGDAGKVEVPYHYSGVWLIRNEISDTGRLEIPLPYSEQAVRTSGWKRCTDSDPEHQTWSFYWYFWDPDRFGCDHKLGREFQNVQVSFGQRTELQTRTYPEYDRMIRLEDGQKTLKLTVAFGYVEDESQADPARSRDPGMAQYRNFLRQVRKNLGNAFVSSPILQKEYLGAAVPEQTIGVRFEGVLRGVRVELKVVTSTDIDQMELFAKSFAHDHDAFFGWFGHSRVGSGFDAESFERMVQRHPSHYSISTDYQLVYWGGCNSYSYYTAPFFDLKARVSGGTDPRGTRNLDILANGMPSYFSLNSGNALIAVTRLLDWENPTSYQDLVTEIHRLAQSAGADVLPVVLGDEDNALPVGVDRR